MNKLKLLVLSFWGMSLMGACPLQAKKSAKGDGYLMVYHKDADHGLHMAYSWDGHTWTALNDDRPIMAGDTIAEQRGIRDPYIFRNPKDGSYLVAMTDLHVFGQRDGVRQTQWERPNEYGWGNNRGLVLLKSDDLIHWRRTNLDFSKLTASDDIIADWKDVGCVWAPEMNYDESRQQVMMHFTTRYRNGRNVIYYAYMNDDFTALASTPKLLFAAKDHDGNINAPTIDSDITLVGDTYHLLMVQFGYIKHATSHNLTGPYVQDNLYNDGEPKRHEAPCVFQIDGEEGYTIMYDNYSLTPHNFGFVKTKDFKTYTPVGYFDEPNCPMRRTNFSEQKHGGIARVAKSKLKKLIRHWKKTAKK